MLERLRWRRSLERLSIGRTDGPRLSIGSSMQIRGQADSRCRKQACARRQPCYRNPGVSGFVMSTVPLSVRRL